MTTAKKSTAKKTTAIKKSVAKPQNEPKKVSKTWLAFMEAVKNPGIKVNDWRAVNK